MSETEAHFSLIQTQSNWALKKKRQTKNYDNNGHRPKTTWPADLGPFSSAVRYAKCTQLLTTLPSKAKSLQGDLIASNNPQSGKINS